MPILNSEAPGLEGVQGWINSEPGSLEEGSYLIDFWSYTCIDCVRKLPLLQEIHDSHPVEVLGVHTPDFSFERSEENVEKAVHRHGIEYPVAVDSGNVVWNTYGNSYWPRQFLVQEGEVVWSHQGKADIGEVEEAVSEVLGADRLGLEVSESRNDRPEDIHLGYERCRGVNGKGNFRGERTFSAPGNRMMNSIYLEGRWRQEAEYLEAVENSRLFLPCSSGEVSIVVHPAGGIRDIEVVVDGGTVPNSETGEDLLVEDRSFIRARRPDLYHILDAEEAERELMVMPEPGTRLFRFSFW